MKWYFASRMRHKEKLVEVSDFLKSKNETILSQWIYEDSLKPYDQNIDKVNVLSKKVVSNLLDSDIFVLISDPEGTDMFIELGVCLAKKELSKNIKIYIVGGYAKRSLMQLHPDILHVKDIKELFTLENIDTQEVTMPKLS